MGQCDTGGWELGGDAQRLEPESRQDDPGVGWQMSAREDKRCIYPGCERLAVPAHALGGPQPSFCDLEEHNALTAHQERQRLAAVTTDEQEADSGG